MQLILTKYAKLLPVSFLCIAVVTVLSLLYEVIAHRNVSMRYVYDANFFVGVVLIATGLVYMMVPSSMLRKDDKMFDHSTFVERSFKARHDRQQRAMKILVFGIFNILITGVLQIILH